MIQEISSGSKIKLYLKSMVKEHPVILSMVYSFLMFLPVYFFAYPKWESSDDFLISGILSGLTGESSPYVLVISYPMSYLLYLLQIWIPQLNWLTMLELFAVWSSFSVFIWAFIKIGNRSSLVIAAIFPIVFEFSFYLCLHYTRSACLLNFAGLFLMYFGCLISKKYISIFLGIGLTVIGYLTRPGTIFLVIPFVGVWLILYICKTYTQYKSYKIVLKRLTLYFFAHILLFILLFTLKAWDRYAYDEFSSSSTYQEFNQARGNAYDYLVSDYQTYQTDFEEIGFSYNDYIMLKGNMIYDDVFNENIFIKIADVNDTRSAPFFDRLKKFEEQFWNRLCYYTSGIRINCHNIFILYAVISIFSIFFIRKKNIFPILSFVIGTMICAVYFIWTGRFPAWVQDSLYVIGGFSILYSIAQEELEVQILKKICTNVRLKSILTSLLYIVTLLVCIYCGTEYFREKVKLGTADYEDNDVNYFLQSMEEDEETIYLIDNFSKSPYPIVNAYGSMRGLKRGSWNNILRVGGWFIGHPVYENQLEELNLDSPITNLLSDNVLLLTNTDSSNLDLYITFFKEHYHVDVYPEMIEQWGKYASYSFHIIESSTDW